MTPIDELSTPVTFANGLQGDALAQMKAFWGASRRHGGHR